ncbi:hypothetical protein AA637_03850 [Cyanobacterium sp. HL-69]|nr:hypothetical protein AA637_03850 [Cyanobacterium sp. HL-69]
MVLGGRVFPPQCHREIKPSKKFTLEKFSLREKKSLASVPRELLKYLLS